MLDNLLASTQVLADQAEVGIWAKCVVTTSVTRIWQWDQRSVFSQPLKKKLLVQPIFDDWTTFLSGTPPLWFASFMYRPSYAGNRAIKVLLSEKFKIQLYSGKIWKSTGLEFRLRTGGVKVLVELWLSRRLNSGLVWVTFWGPVRSREKEVISKSPLCCQL